MNLIAVNRGRSAEAADVLARAMLDDPAGRYLLPDPDERMVAHRTIYADLMARALDEGRVDAWGDPIVGVAIWLRRPPIDSPARSPMPGGGEWRSSTLPPDAVERAERFAAVIRRLRAIARPDEHAYLDSVGVLPGHRRRGIATRLLEAGHAWADEVGLPCALDTLTDENVAFYARRGYVVVATALMPASGLQITAMRRPWGGPTARTATSG